MAIVVEVPSDVQLGVTKATMLRRGLLLRCPVCGGRGVIHHWFGIVDRCPACDLKLERIEGHSIGYIGLNTMVCFTLTFWVVLIGAIIMVPDVRVGPLLIAGLIPAAIGPILFAPGARTVWTAIDLMMRPLKPGEVDPRYVKVDPARDGPAPQA